jgi:hypothetical protein
MGLFIDRPDGCAGVSDQQVDLPSSQADKEPGGEKTFRPDAVADRMLRFKMQINVAAALSVVGPASKETDHRAGAQFVDDGFFDDRACFRVDPHLRFFLLIPVSERPFSLPKTSTARFCSQIRYRMWMIAGPFIPDRFLFLFPVSPLFPTSTVREK